MHNLRNEVGFLSQLINLLPIETPEKYRFGRKRKYQLFVMDRLCHINFLFSIFEPAILQKNLSPGGQ